MSLPPGQKQGTALRRQFQPEKRFLIERFIDFLQQAPKVEPGVISVRPIAIQASPKVRSSFSR